MGEALKAANRIRADVVLELRASNEKARGFYEKWGFVEIGRRPGYYPLGEDAVVMRRLRTFHVEPSRKEA